MHEYIIVAALILAIWRVTDAVIATYRYERIGGIMLFMFWEAIVTIVGIMVYDVNGHIYPILIWNSYGIIVSTWVMSYYLFRAIKYDDTTVFDIRMESIRFSYTAYAETWFNNLVSVAIAPIVYPWRVISGKLQKYIINIKYRN